MWKIEIEADGRWVERDGDHRFVRENNAGGSRLRFTLPRSLPRLLHELSSCLLEPFQLLYVLHTSRGEGPKGRYQSPELSSAELDAFLTRYDNFLAGDGRHDLWLRSAPSDAVIVWDRHNDVFVYGASAIARRLAELGFEEGQLQPLGPHQHHYRAEFDGDARDVLTAFQWWRTGLRPEDEQFVPPVANDR